MPQPMDDDASTSTPMDQTASLAQLPSVAVDDDGWEVESSSLHQPSSDELRAELDRDNDRPSGQTETDAPPRQTAPHGDADEDDSGPDPLEDTSQPAHPKKKKLTAKERQETIRAEINAVVREREEQRRAFERERQEYERWRQQNAPRPPGPQAGTPAATPQPAAAPSGPGEAVKALGERPDWDQYEADGKTFGQYQKDDAKWLANYAAAVAEDRAASIVTTRLEASERRSMDLADQARVEARLETVRKKYTDFDEVVEANLADVPQTPFMRAVVTRHPAGYDLLYALAEHPAEAKILSTLQWTRPMMDAVREAEDPVPLLRHFAQHPEEHARIGALDAPRQLLALGRLSVGLSAGTGAKTSGPPAPAPVTQARPPIRPVGTSRTAVASRSDEDDDDLPFEEWVKRENEREHERQRRRLGL